MQPTAPAVSIIDQHEFNKYAAAWSRHVSHHADLTSVFQQPGGGQLLFVRFPFDTLEYLMSTVGARNVKAQFLLKEDDSSDDKLFALALYATDAVDGRISAYYLAEYPAPAGPVSDGEVGEQIPHQLVAKWLKNWKDATKVTPAMFSSNYGPLMGYTFSIGDFMDPIFYAQAMQTKELRVNFALHAYYPAFPDCHALKQTFGLALRIYSTPAAGDNVGADPTGQPFYDLSVPNPPGY